MTMILLRRAHHTIRVRPYSQSQLHINLNASSTNTIPKSAALHGVDTASLSWSVSIIMLFLSPRFRISRCQDQWSLILPTQRRSFAMYAEECRFFCEHTRRLFVFSATCSVVDALMYVLFYSLFDDYPILIRGHGTQVRLTIVSLRLACLLTPAALEGIYKNSAQISGVPAWICPRSALVSVLPHCR